MQRQQISPAIGPVLLVDRTRTIAAWYTQVVSLSEQVMRFPLDLSAFLKLPGVSPRERQYVVMVAPTRCS
jgi:hypothetical protein